MRGFIFCLCLLVPAALYGQQDSLIVEQLSESVVSAVRARESAPFAVVNLRKAELSDFSTTGRELPLLFSRTPGVLAWGENGLGTGTSYMRIRGVGDSRINVTIDGVPLNSPEDQCVFWANMNGYAAFLGSAQIQRGVGSSTHGDGAFGGSVSLSTKAPSLKPYAEVSSSFGSYNTMNGRVSFSTGLFGRHWVIEGTASGTATEGYLHGTAGNSGSWLASVAYLGDDILVRYSNIGNIEHTGQAWNGVVAGNDDASLMDDGILTYSDIYAHGLGRFNSLYERLVFDDVNGVFPKDADGNYSTERYAMKDGTYWPQTTDNFWQDHNILSLSQRVDTYFDWNAALHYTYGYGYYEEFRYQNKLKKFGLTDPALPTADFVRQKGLEQNTFGLVASGHYEDDEWEWIAGGSMQAFMGNHFGYLTYVSDGLASDILADGPYKYYDSDAKKSDMSAYAKIIRRLGIGWELFSDLQYRYVRYLTDGVNDKFIKQGDGTYQNQELDIDKEYNFFNPKLGVSWKRKSFRAYASAALAHREPERNNFTDNGAYPAPKPERVLDIETGWQYDGDKFRASQNIYWMDYRNQFVQTGAKSDIGEYLTTNIKDSYRLGTELAAAYEIFPGLNLEANAALSQNRILDFDEVVENWEGDPITVHYDNSTLAYSPAAILNGFIDFRMGGFTAVWHTGFVSRQYLDNTANKTRSLPAFSASDLELSYKLMFPKFIREAVFGLNVGNIFNSHHAANGWVYSAVSERYGYTLDKRYCQIGWIPVAGITVMGSLKITFR
ncbi:MAG: TonB-dependent receptor plug domain-containing protein [Bacteroidales bacterium]|nr:TonB-dependent receptor plug domain-containing protein [Bacteroidales bacterium]